MTFQPLAIQDTLLDPRAVSRILCVPDVLLKNWGVSAQRPSTDMLLNWLLKIVCSERNDHNCFSLYSFVIFLGLSRFPPSCHFNLRIPFWWLWWAKLETWFLTMEHWTGQNRIVYCLLHSWYMEVQVHRKSCAFLSFMHLSQTHAKAEGIKIDTHRKHTCTFKKRWAL